MITRDEFVNGLTTRLDGMNDEIIKIEERVQNVKKGSQDKLRARIQYLREKRDSASDRLQEVKICGMDAWEGLKTGVEYTVNSLKEDLTKTLSHFKKHDHA